MIWTFLLILVAVVASVPLIVSWGLTWYLNLLVKKGKNVSSGGVKVEGLAVKLQTAFLGCVKSWITQQPIEVALRVIFSSIRLKIMVGAISDGLGGVTAEKLVADVKKAVNEAAAHHRLIRIASRLLPLVDICIENVSITVLSPGGGVLLQVVGAGRLVSLSWRVPGPHPDDTDVTHPHLLLNCFSDRALELHVPTGPDSKPAALFVSRLTGAVNLWPLLQPLMQPDTAPSLPGTTQSTAISLAVLECAEVRAVNVSSAWRLGLFSALSGGPPPLPKTSDGFCGACALAHTFLSGFHSVGVHILVQRVALEDVVGGVESLPPTVFRPNTLSPTVAECMDSMRVQIAVAEVSQLGLRASLAAEASYMFMGTAEIKAESAALTVNGSPLVLVAKPSVRVEKTLVYEPLAVLPAPLKFARSTSSLMDRPIPNSLTVHADVGSVEASVSNVVFGIATWAAYVALQFRSVTPAPNVPARGPVAQIGPPKVYLTVGAVVIRSLARNDALIGTLSIKSVTVRPTTTQVIPDKRHKLMMLDHRQQHRVWLKTICVTLPSNTAVTHLHAADGTKYTLPSLSPNQSVEAMIIHSVSLQIIPKAAAQRSDPHRITFTTEVARIIPVFDVSVDGVVLSWSERLFHCIGVLISDGLLRTRPLLAVIRHCRGNEPPASVCPSPPHSLKVHLPSAPGVLGEEKEEETLLHSEESSVPFHDQRHVPCFSSPLSGHTRSRRPDCPTTSQHPLPPRSFEAVFGERLGSIPDLGLGPDVFDVHGSPVMRPDRMVRTASRDHGEVILRIPTSPPLDPLNQSSLGSASFGMSRGVGGVITNIRVMFPFELAAPEEDPSSPILRVPMVHEFTVSTADFSAHPPSGQWGLRLHHIEAFARKAPPPTSAVPPRLSSRVSVSDFGGLRDRRPSSAPPMPPPSPATPVQFDDGAKYLDLQNFAVEECPVHVPSLEPGVEFNTSIIDIFGHGLCGIWTPTLQLALFQCVQLVTHSVWDMLDYQREGRSAGIPAAEVDNYGPGYNPRPRDMNLPYLDVEEALRLLRLLTHSISAQGDKLHRFFTRDICLDAKFWLDPKFGPGVHAPSQWACPVNEIIRSIRPPAPSLHLLPLTFRIRVGEFAGVDMPDKWHIEDLSVSLEDIQCFRMVSAEVTHTVDRRNDVILGDLALSLRHRLRCLHAVKCVLPGGNLPTPLQFPSGGKLHSHQRLLQSLLFGEEGIALDIIGLSVDIPHQIQLGPLFDSVLLQVASLVTILQKTFTGWHAGDDRHWTYFTRLAPTGFALRCDLQELGTMSGSTHPRPELDTARAPSRNPVPCIPHIWLQCREAKLCVADDPLETWLSKQALLWSDLRCRRVTRESFESASCAKHTTVAPEVWDFVRSKRDRTESTLLAVSVDRVNVDVSLSTLWCPPAGVQVTSDGSVVSVSPSSFHHLYPADLSMPYAGSVPCPSDVACFVKCMSRLPELGKCTLPGVVPCMPLDPVCVMGAPLGDGASSFHACVTAACDALRIRKFDEAELLFTRATELAEEGDGRVEEAQALGGLALLSAYQHRYESARGLFMRASDVCCSAGNSVLGCKMEMGAALAACLIGQTDTRPLIWSALNRLTDPRAMQAVAGTIRRWSTECAAGVEATQLNILDTFLYSVFGCCGDFGSQSSKAFLPEMSSCVTMKATFNCERTDVRLRDFPQSLASLGSVVGTCLATLAQQATDTVFHKAHRVKLGCLPAVTVTQAMCPPKLYGTLDAHADNASMTYSPGYEFTISELFQAMRRIMPSAVDPSPGIPYWDIVRHVVHVTGRVNIRGASVKLLSSPDPKNDSEYFDLQVCDAVLLYEGQGDVLLEFEEASMHQMPMPKHQSLLATVPQTGFRLKLGWLGCSSVHHLYPPVVLPGYLPVQSIAIGGTEEPFLRPPPRLHDTYASFRSSGFSLAISCSFGQCSISSSSSSPFPSDEATPSILKGKKIVATLNGSMLGGQWNWLQAYQHIPPYPIPRKYRSGLRHPKSFRLAGTPLPPSLHGWISRSEANLPSFIHHMRKLKLAVASSGLSADIREHMTALWGIRVSVKGGFCVGVTFQEEETIPDPFLTGRVVIPVVSHRMWSVHNVICEVADMDLRLKEFPSSSAPPAGPPPPSTPWDDTKLKLLAVAHFRIAQPNAKQLSDMVAQSPVRPGSRSARPKSGYPYLYNCDIDGLRVLVNLHSRDLLLQLADAYLSVVLSSLPSYQRPPKHLMDASSRSSTTPNTTPRIPGGSAFPSVPISPSSLIWNKLFHITARSFQISVMDEAKNGIILVTGNRVRVTNHVTTTAHRERIHLEVSDLCVYIAPTDVDVGAVYPWLWNFDEGKPVLYSSTSTLNSSASKIVGSLLGLQGESAPEAVGIGHTGIFKAVTSPFPVSCTIMVSHQQNEELAAAWLLVPVLPQPPSPDDVTSVRVSASVASLTVHLEAKEFVIVYDIVMHTLMAPLPPNMKLFVPKAPVDDILEPEVKSTLTVRQQFGVKQMQKWTLENLRWLKVHMANVTSLPCGCTVSQLMCEARLAPREYAAATDLALATKKLDWVVKKASMAAKSKPNFEVWFGSDVVQVLLLKGAFPIMDATVRQIMGSAVGFEDSATGLTLSIGKAIVRDLRPGAPFPVVFDVWHEKAMTMGANSVMQIGMASMPDLSTSGINTGLDAALLATLVQSSTVPPISPTPTAFSDVATPALQSRPPLLRAVSRPDLLSSEGDPSNRVTEALRRIECGLHVDGDVDRHGVVNMGIPLDAPDTWAIVMQGVDLDVTSWESAGSPLAAASLWGATSGFYAAEASGPQRTSVDVLGESMGKPDSGPSNSDGSPPIPLLHIQAFLDAPVDGVPVVRHAEVNALPLKAQVSMDLIHELIVFFDPNAWKSKQLHELEEEQRRNFLIGSRRSFSSGTISVSSAPDGPEPITKQSSIRKASSKLFRRPSRTASSTSSGSGENDSTSSKPDAVVIFKHIRMGGLVVFGSFKGHSSLEDVQGLVIVIHARRYSSMTCTPKQLLLKLRNDIILDILSQAGRNLENIWRYVKRQVGVSRDGTEDAEDPDGDETASTGARPVAYSESFPSSTSSAAAVEQDASFLLLGVRTQPVAKEDGITARLKSWLKKSSKK